MLAATTAALVFLYWRRVPKSPRAASTIRAAGRRHTRERSLNWLSWLGLLGLPLGPARLSHPRSRASLAQVLAMALRATRVDQQTGLSPFRLARVRGVGKATGRRNFETVRKWMMTLGLS